MKRGINEEMIEKTFCDNGFVLGLCFIVDFKN